MKRPLLALALLTGMTASGALAQSAPMGGRVNQCFRSHDYQSFRPIDEHAFYIRVNNRDFYRIEVQGSCPALTYPQATLITTVRGSDEICGPLDWDLRIGQGGLDHFAEPCIVKSQTRLTPEEAAAIPQGQKP